MSLSTVFNSEGLFSRTHKTAGEYNKSKAREKLETAFSDLQIEKYERGLTPDALSTRITEEIGKMGGTEIGDDKTQVIVDGYIFQVDRSIPKIIKELGLANEGLVRDETPPEIKTAEAKASGMKITIQATAEDKESGISSLKYSITPTTGIPKGKNEGDLPQNGTAIEITSTVEEKYTVTFTATNGAELSTIEIISNVTTIDGGVIKHIRTQKGLEKINTKDIYGATVTGYTCDRKKEDGTELEWQIFYIDETKDEEGNVTDSQVYLIANDYAVPPTTDTELLHNNVNLNAYYWTAEVLEKYKTNLPDISNESPMGKFMGKFLNDYAGVSALSANLQATNYMLDQEVWKEYKGTKAELAFGGPTLPLFQASYNDVSKTANKLWIAKCDVGYQVKKGNNGWYTSQGGFGSMGTQKGIYFGEYDMWIASPSHMEGLRINVSTKNGYISANRVTDSNPVFRPIVCLQSTVEFGTEADGNYRIVN